MVQYLENYSAQIIYKVVRREISSQSWFKCNSDGASKEKPCPSSTQFCIRNNVGSFIHARANRIPNTTNIYAETMTFGDGLNLCISNNLVSVVMETDSLTLKKVLEGEWEIPWNI